jgi:hypothetical protein
VREEGECKEREAALVRDEARVAEIRASQTAPATNDAVATVIYLAAGAIWRLTRTGRAPSLRQGQDRLYLGRHECQGDRGLARP